MIRRASCSLFQAPRFAATTALAATSMNRCSWSVAATTTTTGMPQNCNLVRFQSSSNGSGNSKDDDIRGSVEASDDTHPDFAPKPVKPEDLTEEREQIMQDIRDTLKEEEVVIFIKGVAPDACVCSYSHKLVNILEALGCEYTSFDVLAHPVVRSYVKELSEWQTIPQMFVKGEFVGGVDVISEMAKTGQLQIMFEKKGIKHRPHQF